MDEILNLIESVSEGFPSYSFVIRSLQSPKIVSAKTEATDQTTSQLNQELHCSHTLLMQHFMQAVAELKIRWNFQDNCKIVFLIS